MPANAKAYGKSDACVLLRMLLQAHSARAGKTGAMENRLTRHWTRASTLARYGARPRARPELANCLSEPLSSMTLHVMMVKLSGCRKSEC